MTKFKEAFTHIDRFVKQKMQIEGIPGMAVALTDRRRLLRISTYGFANLESQLPVTSETLFEIGSISKSFTSIALLQQWEKGIIKLQEPVTSYLPWFQVQSEYEPITVHHLMSHTAGLILGTELTPGSRYEVIALRETTIGFPPGKHFYYSNVAYQALGYLLEDLLDQKYREIIQVSILDPLDMTSSVPVITHETRKCMATGYHKNLYDDRPNRISNPPIPAPWFEYGVGYVSVASTPIDMATYLRMLLNHGRTPHKRIFSEESFSRLTQQAIKVSKDTFYGYGLGTAKRNSHIYISHAGSMIGFSSSILGDIDDGLGAVVLINLPTDASAVAQFALETLQATLNNQALPSLQQPVTNLTQIKKASDYAGVYRSATKMLTLFSEGEQLLLQHGTEQIVLEQRYPDSFYVDHPDFSLFLLRFERKDNQVVEAFHGPDWYVNHYYTGPTCFDYPKEWEAYQGHYRSYNPCIPSFRVFLRKGMLVLCFASGYEQTLVPLNENTYRIGEESYSPERLRFDTIVNHQALRASLSGCYYYLVSSSIA